MISSTQQLICCPNCHHPLQDQTCTGCHTHFPATLGILDLRWPRPEQSDTAEETLIQQMLEAFPHSTFAELTQLRYSVLDEGEILDIYTNYFNTLETRGQQMMTMFHQRISDYFTTPSPHIALDLGCGTGASSVVLCQTFDQVIGIEPSLATLILARKFLESAGHQNILLIQAYGQHLPLKTDAIDYAVAQNVIEHLLNIEPAFQELNRVLKAGGYFCGDSRNRFDLLFPEPHSNLRLVGFLPYKWQSRYVERFAKVSYDGTRLLSLYELSQTAKRTFGRSKIVFPYASAYGQSAKWDTYLQQIERIPLLNTLALLFFPSHLLLAQAK